MSDDFTGQSRGRSWRSVLDVAVQVAFIAAAATIVYGAFAPTTLPPQPSQARGQGKPELPVPDQPLSLEGAEIRGNKSARVVLIEYSDLQCPYCAKFARETLPAIDEKYVAPGKVQVAFRHYPLPIHPEAHKAAEAVECAASQGRFWEMRNILFRSPKQLPEARLRDAAQTLGLDLGTFDTCLAGQMTSKVQSDTDAAQALGISGTPSFFIGEITPDGRVKVARRLSGAQPAVVFEEVFDKLLSGS